MRRCALLLLAAAAPPPAPLTIYLPPSVPPAMATAVQQAVNIPFAAATHHPVRLSRTLAHPYDIALMDDVALATGCADGSLLPLDETRLGRLGPTAATGCAASAGLTTLTLAWDNKRLAIPPDWGTFWNVARTPGQRGLYQGAEGTLEIALLADGVSPRDLYAVLGSADGVDRALRKLDQLRPYIVWWRSGAEAAANLLSGKVLMSSAPSPFLHKLPTIASADAVGLLRVQGWSVRAASLRTDAAIDWIKAAETATAAARIATAGGLASATTGSLQFDADFWSRHAAETDKRFAAWFAGLR